MIRLDRDAMVDLAQNGPSVCSDMGAFHRLRASRIRSSHRLHLRRYIVPITRSSLRATMAPVDQTGRAEVRRRLPGEADRARQGTKPIAQGHDIWEASLENGKPPRDSTWAGSGNSVYQGFF